MSAHRWAIVSSVVDPEPYAEWLESEGASADAAQVLGGHIPPDVVVAWCDSEVEAADLLTRVPPIPGVKWLVEAHRIGSADS